MEENFTLTSAKSASQSTRIERWTFMDRIMSANTKVIVTQI